MSLLTHARGGDPHAAAPWPRPEEARDASGVMPADPDPAPLHGFAPTHGPLGMPDGGPADSIQAWMRFAVVLE